MKIKLLFIIVFSALSLYSKAQTTDTTKHWTKGGLFSTNFSQVALSNWAAGGQNSISVITLLSTYANYKKGETTWDNTLDLSYGLLQQGTVKLRKNEDKIDLNSKYGRYAFKYWYYSFLLNFKTQFAPGFNYPNDSTRISDFLAPAYVVTSVGMDYKPKDYFSVFIGPLTAKTTIVGSQLLANAGAFGVEKATYDNTGNLISKGKLFRNELGGYLKIGFRKDIFTNVNLQSKLELFSNYLKNPQNIDINWESLISMKINKYLSATISAQVIYDDDIIIVVSPVEAGPRTQFKEAFGLGLSYKF